MNRSRLALAAACLFSRARGRRHPAHAAEHRLHPGRRPRLRRPRLLRAEEDQDAEPRPAGGRGHAVHAVLRRQHGLRPVAVRADDRPAHRPLPRPRQRRQVPLRARPDVHRRRAAEAGRLRDRRSSASGGWAKPGTDRHPDQEGLRPLLRLPEPAPRPQLLPRLPLARTTRRSRSPNVRRERGRRRSGPSTRRT